MDLVLALCGAGEEGVSSLKANQAAVSIRRENGMLKRANKHAFNHCMFIRGYSV